MIIKNFQKLINIIIMIIKEDPDIEEIGTEGDKSSIITTEENTLPSIEDQNNTNIIVVGIIRLPLTQIPKMRIFIEGKGEAEK